MTPVSRMSSLFCYFTLVSNFTLILDFRVLSQLFVNKGHDRHSFSYLQIEILESNTLRPDNRKLIPQ